MNYTFNIPDRLPGLNEFIDALRRNKYKGAQIKREKQEYVSTAIRYQLRKTHTDKPVCIHYVFFEKNKRRDLDNIAGFAHKVIQDALVECGVIKNDGWAYVIGFTDAFQVDGRNPRIEVTLEEIERTNKNEQELQRDRRYQGKNLRVGSKNKNHER